MSVRKRKWRDKQGRQHEKWMVHICHTWPDGRKQTIRKVSPVQTKRGAEQYERELRKQLVSSQWEEDANKKRQQTPTLAGFAEEFLAYQATLNKPGSVDTKRTMLRLHLLPAFGKRRLDRIDERAIDAYTVKKLEHVTHRGTPILPSTVNMHLKLLGRMLRVARKWKLIRELPEINLLKERKPDFDFLDFDEADVFLRGAAQHRPQWHPYMVTAIRTGLRVGEMVALRWRDVDLERGRITVRRSYDRKRKAFASTKNDKIRDIPLTRDALDALRTQRERGPADRELVFVNDLGNHFDSHATQYAIEKIAEALGMRHIHNHVLRHTFASHAAMRGIPIPQIQQWLGHSSIVVTMRYAHLSRGVGDDLIQRLNPTPQGRAGGRGAGLEHMESTRTRDSSNSAPQTPVRH